MLEDIFRMQLELNDYVFKKNNLKNKSGDVLNMQAIITAVKNEDMMVNDLPNKWLVNYSKAIKEELSELDEELLWKWWSKDEIDMQNIRVELIDILHFLISAMMCAGLTAEKVFDIYQQKHAVNIKRQDMDYNKKIKTEDDNKDIH
ncbi:MAG TPA: dUTPase [Gammaproteobacteria bacterium]|jgi:dimeric dUTPase (all-alpha-NTP-PPase superfamily)|nr:dUTPase [Gammaproteobacteria bacterium]|tara:strand:+ start:206 stop:643 length:438 start_codon:yes stop_codon:yes gene_type:complete